MDFSTFVKLWARVRGCAGIFAHTAITDIEAEAVKLYQQFEARLVALELEKAAGVTAPASTEKPAA
jgi:hypothetical protein